MAEKQSQELSTKPAGSVASGPAPAFDLSIPMPDARLIIAPPPAEAADPAALYEVTGSAMPLPYAKEQGWEILGLVQTTQHVDFCFRIPFQRQPLPPSSPSSAVSSHGSPPLQLRCRIQYDSSGDECVLVNDSDIAIALTSLDEDSGCGSTPSHASPGQPGGIPLPPGAWRLFTYETEAKSESEAGNKATRQQPLVDMLIMRRIFDDLDQDALALVQPTPSMTWSKDVTELLLLPRTPLLPDQIANPEDLWTARLQDISLNTLISIPRGPQTKLSRLYIGPSYGVFVGRHMRFANPVVRVERYACRHADDLAACVRAWRREVRLLARVKHQSIMSISPSRANLYSLHTNRLPHYIDTGPDSTHTPQDAAIILRDISSALAYLSTHQISHNDVNPTKIAYSPSRGAVLFDFSLATTAYHSSSDDDNEGGAEDDGHAATEATCWYLPPEFTKDQARNNPGDVFALGITLLYLLKKIRRPRETHGGWLLQHVSKPGYSRTQMQSWLGHVSQVRATALDRGNLVEDLVYQMLEEDAELRPEAGVITSACDGIVGG